MTETVKTVKINEKPENTAKMYRKKMTVSGQNGQNGQKNDRFFIADSGHQKKL